METKDFKVRVEMPDGVTVKEMADFIRECVSNPVVPFVRMDWDKVTVKLIGGKYFPCNGITKSRANRTLDGIFIASDGSIEGRDANL